VNVELTSCEMIQLRYHELHKIHMLSSEYGLGLGGPGLGLDLGLVTCGLVNVAGLLTA